MSTGPYSRNPDQYYGDPRFSPPYPPYYHSIRYHREPPRKFPGSSGVIWFNDAGEDYVLASKPADANDPVLRSAKMANIINIETAMTHLLHLHLYAFKEEDDVDLELKLGKQYSVTYITEGGLQVCTGILKYIDTTIPDTCTRYIGEFNESINTAWIGLDCSTNCNSDKRKIYVAAIRGIEEVPEDDSDYTLPEIDTDSMTDSQKLDMLVSALPGVELKLDKILLKVADNDEILSTINNMSITEKFEYILNKLDENIVENINAHSQAQQSLDQLTIK